MRSMAVLLESRLNKITSIIENILFYIAGIILFVLMLLMMASIIARIGFSYGLAWTVEISAYSLLYITFFSASWILNVNGHVTLDLFINSMKPERRWKLDLFIYTAILIASLTMVYFGSKMVIDFYTRNILLIATLTIPKYLIAIPIPLGSFVILLRSLQRLLHRFLYKSESVINEETVSA